ncbi:hypothetical protein STEG23_030589 [Scotinomys teguina]
MLAEKGLKVTSPALAEFLSLVKKLCPWFSEDGSLTLAEWKKNAESPIWIPDRLIRPAPQEKHEAMEKGETEKEETPVSHEETFGFSAAATNFDPDNYADD